MNEDQLMGVMASDISSVYPGLLTVANGASAITGATITANTISNVVSKLAVEDILDEYEFNRVAVDYKVTAQELLKLKETAPDYAQEIKESIAKGISREVVSKITYTKKHDKDADVHHFIGRVWVFTDEELKAILRVFTDEELKAILRKK